MRTACGESCAREFDLEFVFLKPKCALIKRLNYSEVRGERQTQERVCVDTQTRTDAF